MSAPLDSVDLPERFSAVLDRRGVDRIACVERVQAAYSAASRTPEADEYRAAQSAVQRAMQEEQVAFVTACEILDLDPALYSYDPDAKSLVPLASGDPAAGRAAASVAAA